MHCVYPEMLTSFFFLVVVVVVVVGSFILGHLEIPTFDRTTGGGNVTKYWIRVPRAAIAKPFKSQGGSGLN